MTFSYFKQTNYQSSICFLTLHTLPCTHTIRCNIVYSGLLLNNNNKYFIKHQLSDISLDDIACSEYTVQRGSPVNI